jgi:GTP-binding protein HflX
LKSFFEETPVKRAKRRAIVVGVYQKEQAADHDEDTLGEIVSLCKTAGARIVGKVVQLVDRYNPSTMLGSGKVDELAALVRERKADLAVFDSGLSPSQQVNLEKRTGIQVIDRPGIILDIFALHARTREARVQVELAQLEYLLPRLAGGWTHLERQEGSIGTRGPGETQLETDRRLVRKRIRDLRRKLASIEIERHTQRKKREGIFKVCLVGYTNAGKSTIFNLLTGDDVLAESYLFATLDSTTRRIKLSGRNHLLLSDTVGFIRKLPVSLVASFKSTLMEVSGADLLLHVVDVSDRECEERIAVVNGILGDIGCGDIQIMHVFNKIDLRNHPDLFRSLLGKYPGTRFVSAVTGEGMKRVISDLESFLERSRVTVTARITSGNREKLNLISSVGHLIDSVTDDGVLQVRARIPRIALGKLKSEGIELTEMED